MKLLPRPLVLVLLAVSLAAGNASAAGSKAPTKANMEEAQKRYERGRDLYEESDYRGALVEFQRAYELAPSFRLLYSIALVQYQLQDYASSMRSYQQYLQEGGNDIPAQRREEVQRELNKLRSRVATLTITTDRPGAEVSVDDVVVGTTPLQDPVIVSAGRRRITATLPGQPPVSRAIDVAGTDSVNVALAFGAPKETPAPVATAPREQAPVGVTEKAQPRGIPWVAWGTTGALAVATGVTGVMALGAQSDLKKKRDTFGVSKEELADASQKTKRFGLMTDVLGGATLVAAGISTYLTLTRNPSEPAETTSLHLGVGPGSVGVAGTFP
ncbi:PEGA domain-containing protein [Hyalangium versicolor]|uniref:PEGA domain-containing protein n=1 Tax=Hyalangium versicolor TaxID=2861190 RepID=UPI001CCB9B19|nr:PEGA domain-containing protein [Hyalangium versicolor]